MNQYNLYRFTSVALIILAIFSYFFGFYLDENSAGAGKYTGDFEPIYNNLQIFLKNNLDVSIVHPDYHDSRAPLAYILHEMFNPFVEDKLNFRKSVFFISLLVPILFYYSLKKKFKNEEKLLLILLSCTIFLSPYFRTSAFWGLQENYGLIFLLLTFLSISFLDKENEQSELREYINLFFITFFSSLSFYFDQKLIIISIICFINIIFSKKLIKFKIFSILCYFIFSLPYIYLMLVWGSLIPTNANEDRHLGEAFNIDHLGYASTMIAFYLLPLLLFKGKNFLTLMKDLFLDKKNYFLIIPFFLYLFYLSIFFEFSNELSLGGGFINKISLLLFDNNFLRSTFIYFSFLFSWLIIIVYFDKNFREYIVLSYFLILSIIIWPMFQEYFDPLILILAFTFLNSKIYLNYKNSIVLFIYLSFFLFSTNVYYLRLLN